MKKLFLLSLLSFLSLSCGNGNHENSVTSYVEDLDKPEYAVPGYFSKEDWTVTETERGMKNFEIDKRIKIDDPMLRGVKGETELVLNFKGQYPIAEGVMEELPPQEIMGKIISSAIDSCKEYEDIDGETVDPRRITINILTNENFRVDRVFISIYFGAYDSLSEETLMITFEGTYNIRGEAIVKNFNI